MFNMLNRVGPRSRAASLATPMIPTTSHHGSLSTTTTATTTTSATSPSRKKSEGTTSPSPSSIFGGSPPSSPLRISSSSPSSLSPAKTITPSSPPSSLSPAKTITPSSPPSNVVFSRSRSVSVSLAGTPPRAPSPLAQIFEALKGNNEREIEAAGKALLNTTSTTNMARRSQVVDHPGFARVIQLVGEGTSRARILMTAIVSNLATTSDDIRTKLVVKEAVAPLVANLASQNHSVQQISMQAVCNLAAGSGRTAIVEAGGIPRIVEVLRTGAEECKPHAVGALNNLSSLSDEAKAAIFDAGAVPLLVGALESGGHESKERAAYSLWNLSSIPHIRSHLFSIGAAKHIVKQLTCPDHSHSLSPRSSPVVADTGAAGRRRAASISS